MRPHRGWLFVLAFLGLNLCAAGPVPEGHTVGARVGGMKYDAVESKGSGCSGSYRRYRVAAVPLVVEASTRSEEGLTAVAELDLAPGRVVWEEPAADWAGSGDFDVGDWTLDVGASARVGYHGRRAGVELGVATLSDRIPLYPSAMVWGGVPHYAYGYLALLNGPVDPTYVGTLEAGIGHRSEHVNAELGVLPGALRAELGLPLAGPWELRTEGGVDLWEDLTYRATLGVSRSWAPR